MRPGPLRSNARRRRPDGRRLPAAHRGGRREVRRADLGLAAEKRKDTLAQELRNFFAGARATEVTEFDASPWPGKLSCGFLPIAGHPTVCAWADSATSGAVMLADEKGLGEAAEIARQFRTASEKRT